MTTKEEEEVEVDVEGTAEATGGYAFLNTDEEKRDAPVGFARGQRRSTWHAPSASSVRELRPQQQPDYDPPKEPAAPFGQITGE